MKFPCDNCVLCCKQRPDACDVKKMHEAIYEKKIDEKEYIKMKRGECKQIKQGLEAYEAYIDRISLPTKPVKLMNEEIEQLKKDGRI